MQALRPKIRITFMMLVLAQWTASVFAANIDHIVVGVSDLDQAVDTFERLTGVRPVYGGKHPGGTHNALVSLGDRTYLELIALQSGAPPPPHLPDLNKFKDPTPIGWAVSASNSNDLRDRLAAAGFSVTEPQAGSRVTPGGQTLRWQTFFIQPQLIENPFFILWDPQSPHPSTTSPPGCMLIQWVVSGPNGDKLEALRMALGLQFETRHSQTVDFILELNCPKGNIVFPLRLDASLPAR